MKSSMTRSAPAVRSWQSLVEIPIEGKTVNPTWILPESIKEEHRRDGKPAPDFIAGGDPENPLGKYRLELTLPLYGIHGTDIPWGVGMQVSHGCVRLYPEDIERLFPLVSVGAAGEFTYQPVKVGVRGGAVYLETHRDIYGYAPAFYREASVALERARLGARADRDRLLAALEDLSGVPMRISPEPDEPAPASAQAVPVAPTEVSHDGAPHPDKEQAGND